MLLGKLPRSLFAAVAAALLIGATGPLSASAGTKIQPSLSPLHPNSQPSLSPQHPNSQPSLSPQHPNVAPAATSISLSPTPIAAPGSLGGSASVNVTLSATASGVFGCLFGCTVFLSFVPTAGGGSAAVGATSLNATFQQFVTDAGGGLTITYDTPATLPTAGTDTLWAQDAATSPTITAKDTYTYAVSSWVFTPSPIAANGSLAPGQTVDVTLTAKDNNGDGVAQATIDLTFSPAPGGGSAAVGSTALSGLPQEFTTDANGNIGITYTASSSPPPAGGTDLIRAFTQICLLFPPHCFQFTKATDTYTYATVFYFAEGTTRAGFTETLSLLMPNSSGTATINYIFANGSAPVTKNVAMTAGQVSIVDVNADVGPDQDVSAKVTLPGAGIAERTMHFNTPLPWHGSHDKVGVNQPAVEWDFAEGSTLSVFSEYLTLQNPGGLAAHTNLNYVTDSGATVTKSLVLPPNSRTTVEVFNGSMSAANPCVPNGAGASCGVGRGIGGVSVQVLSIGYCFIPSPFGGCLVFVQPPIIAERPMYVNSFGFDFPSGTISDGHDAFGANGPATDWRFAEGTTLSTFREYLTLQNANSTAAAVTLTYDLSTGGAPPVKSLAVPANTRVTVEVFHGDTSNNPSCGAGANGNCGVGPGIGGVSVSVHSTLPIVAERPMYMMQDFGTGVVAGAHDVVGALNLGTIFGFSAGSTLAGENDYLTIQNPGSPSANINLTYYARECHFVPFPFPHLVCTWSTVHKSFAVAGNSRQTVEVFNGSLSDVTGCVPNGAGASCGVGGGFFPVGIVLSSDQAVLVERPTYNSTSAAYGATDTLAFQPPSGF